MAEDSVSSDPAFPTPLNDEVESGRAFDDVQEVTQLQWVQSRRRPSSATAEGTEDGDATPSSSRSSKSLLTIVQPSWKINLDRFHKYEMHPELTKKARKFYARQNDQIDQFADLQRLDSVGEEGSNSDEARRQRLERLCPAISIVANILLLAVKIFVAMTSGSLSIVASMLDSLLDLLSGTIVLLTTWLMGRKDYVKYPQGKTRMEPVGVIVVSCVMCMVSLNVILESVKKFTADEKTPPEMEKVDIILMSSVVVVKAGLWLLCRSVKGSGGVEALAQDHRNDVLTNAFGMLFGWLGAKYAWWLDPLGAALFSTFVIWSWASMGLENITMLVGKSAPVTFIQQLTYITMNHHADVIAVDTVRAFHFGENYLVEVDIVLPENMPLKQTHDIGESLQTKLERLDNVDRAFVHVDYEFDHLPEHKQV